MITTASPRRNTLLKCLLALPLAVWTGSVCSQTAGPVKVTVKDGKVVTGEGSIPVDPTPRIRVGTTPGAFNFGLAVDGKNITCSTEGSIWLQARIDGQEIYVGPNFNAPGVAAGNQAKSQPLPGGPSGKKRQGYLWRWQHQDLHFTQIVEIVPSKPTTTPPQPGQKRRMDTCRITHLVENKGTQPRKVELRQGVDMLIVNNDGALYASPSTQPGKVLNGVELKRGEKDKDKMLPDFVHCLQIPNAANPGFVATITLKLGSKVRSPDRILLTNLGTVSQWNVPAQPAGDSACAICWDAVEVKPGAKQEFAWGYGGGYACDPENDGVVHLALGGSFEPNKTFTITAYVDDPAPNQTLTLELPPGMERVEGKELQPVPAPAVDGATSVVMWKARVLRTGDFSIKVKSSSGVTQIKNISIAPAGQ